MITVANMAPAQSNNMPPSNLFVVADGDHLVVTGSLDSPTDVDKVINTYNNANPKPTIFHMDSGGGITTVGMALGRFIYDNDMDVKITNFCFSSCANYIFPAGKTKYIGKNAVIGWHGDATSSGYYLNTYEEPGKNGESPEVGEIRKAMLEMCKREGIECTEDMIQEAIKNTLGNGTAGMATNEKQQEEQFYTYIGHNPMVSRYGHMMQDADKFLSQPPAHIQTQIMGWTYTPEVMQQFGMKNIVLMDGWWGFEAERYAKQYPVTSSGATLQLITKLQPIRENQTGG